jgi:hypothetical protein
MPDPVVITRPLAQCQALADRVAALGREAVLLPLLEILPLPDQGELQRALAGLADYALVASRPTRSTPPLPTSGAGRTAWRWRCWAKRAAPASASTA